MARAVLPNAEHRFWVGEEALLNFSLTGRFRDSDLTRGYLDETLNPAKEPIDFYIKGPNEYRSRYDRYRIMNYRHNKLLYQGDHFDVFRYFRYILDSFTGTNKSSQFFDNRNKLIVYVVINLLGLISRKIADLIAVETPEITPWKKAPKKIKEAIDRISKQSKFQAMLYNSALTIGVKGDGIWIPEVFTLHGKNAIRIKRVMPETWFPTLNISDLQNIQEHVFAWKFSGDNGRTILRRQTYGPGYIRHEANWLEDNEDIGAPLSDTEIIKYFAPEGLPPNAIFRNIKDSLVTHIPNIQFDEQHPFGISDYVDLKGPMDEINHRMTQIALELDKHANLSMRGPAVGKQETPVGKYFVYDADEPPPEYISLPTQAIGVMMDEVELLIKWVLTLSETSPGLVGLKEGSGVVRAEALRIESSNSITKAMRKQLYLTEAIQKAFRDAMLLENEMGIETYKIDGLVGVVWKDGLPDTESEKAELMSLRTGGKPTISTMDAVKRLDGEGSDETLKNLLDESEQEMLQQIQVPEDDINGNPQKQ